MKLVVTTVKAKCYVDKLDITSVHDATPQFIDGLKSIEGEISFTSEGDFSEYIDHNNKLKDKFYIDLMNGEIPIYKKP